MIMEFSDEEKGIVRYLFEQNLISRDQLKECLDLLRTQREGGIASSLLKGLEELKYLTGSQIRDVCQHLQMPVPKDCEAPSPQKETKSAVDGLFADSPPSPIAQSPSSDSPGAPRVLKPQDPTPSPFEDPVPGAFPIPVPGPLRGASPSKESPSTEPIPSEKKAYSGHEQREPSPHQEGPSPYKVASAGGPMIDSKTLHRYEDFGKELAGAFLYPLYGSGLAANFSWFLITIGAILLCIIFWPVLIAPGLALIVYGGIFLAFLSLMASHLLRIILCGVRNERKIPPVPPFSNFMENIGKPGLMAGAALLMCYFPYLIARWAQSGGWSYWHLLSTEDNWLSLIFFFGGTLFFPICGLHLAITDSVLSLKPGLILMSLRIIWVKYLIVLALVTVLKITAPYLNLFLFKKFPWYLSFFLFFFFYYYFLMVEAYTLGLIYNEKAKEFSF